jgi:uncharacterized protein YcbX
MPVVTQLYVYPIKSCGGISHSQLTLDQRDPLGDRRWMIVDGDGNFITAREQHTMLLIQPALADQQLRLSAPNLPDIQIPLQRDPGVARSVNVWGDICDAWDEGDKIAAWFSDYLKTSVRLVRMTDSFDRIVNPQVAKPGTTTRFTDGYPILIVSEASLADLNQRLIERGGDPVHMQRFRPNVVVSGCDAFAEDSWQTIQIGTLTIDVVKPCARCVLTSIDPATGTVPDPAEPLATLNTYRKQGSKVMFAQNAVHRLPGTLSVGDPVLIEQPVSVH